MIRIFLYCHRSMQICCSIDVATLMVANEFLLYILIEMQSEDWKHIHAMDDMQSTPALLETSIDSEIDFRKLSSE